LILVLVFATSGLATAKDEEPTLDEKAEDYAKSFKKEYKKMPSAQLIEAVDKMMEFYANKDVTDKGARKALLDGIARAASVRDKAVVAHVMKQGAKLEEEDALKILLPTLSRELAQKVPNESVYEAALSSLAKIRSEHKLAIKTLTKLLKDKDNVLVGLAARTIAGYKDASGRTRKELFEEVLKATEGVYSGAQNQNQTLERKWNVIEQDVMDALQKLSGAKLQDPAQARSWFNDNKKRSWDPEPEK
jgi:hypothetical protein